MRSTLHRRTGALGAAVLLALVASGCRPAASTPPPAPPVAPPAGTGVTSSTERALDSQPGAGSIRGTVEHDKGLVDLRQIAQYYQLHQADGAQARDLILKDIQKDLPKLYQAIQKGDYVLLPGDPAQAPAGTSNTVVAFMRDAPTQGGVVALLDGSARNMSAADFQAAGKLGQ